MSDKPDTAKGLAFARHARELFERAKRANDPESRDALPTAAWYWADRAEHEGVFHD